MSIAVDNPPTETIGESAKPPPAAVEVRPRRTLNRLALALAGLVAGAVGQYFFNQGALRDGLLLYGVAVILFVRALARQYAFSDRSPTGYRLPIANYRLLLANLQPAWRRKAGVWLILIALGGSYLTYTLFGHEEGRLLAWRLYFGGLALFISGVLLLTRSRAWPAEWDRLFPDYYTLIGLAVIMGLALFMRLYRFDSLPFGIWFDEAEAGLQARRILAEPTYRPLFYPPINVSGHLLALYAAALYWLGDSIQSMRLVSVVFGLGGTAAAYLFGRELRGPRLGLTLAFLMAVARWPVNFSRIAMTGVDAPFFEFLSLFFLIRWLRSGQLRDAMGAGLTLGAGLLFYTAFRLYVAALVLFIIVAGLVWRRWVGVIFRDRNWAACLGQLGVLLAAGWLVVLPLVQVALQEPEAFWYRTQQISIFTRRDQADVFRALRETTVKHLLMFNVQGDKNGRHNLPGEPMLDPAMAVLGVLGLGLAIRQLGSDRYRLRPAHLFFMILFGTALMGGVLTVDFEAPQSLRSIAVIPAAFYFCAIAVAALGREADRVLHPLPRAWVLTPAVGLAGFVFFSNASTYFLRQANDFASWNAFSTPETIVGREMADLGPAYRYVLSPFFINHPTIRFLAPEADEQEALVLPGALPLRQPADQPVAMFIHPDDAAVFHEAQRLYPNAGFELAASETVDERPVVYMVALQPADIAAVQGLQLTYSRADSEESPPGTTPEKIAAPLQSGRAKHINVTWPQDSPVAEDFVAEWTGLLYAPLYGAYHLRLLTPGPARLEIDGFTIFEGPGEQLTTVVLAQGDHSIRLRAEAASGQTALYWQPPGAAETLVPAWSLYAPPLTNNGLKGAFYPNANWEGEPVLERIDPYLDTYFHLIPLQRPYSVEWTGWLDAPLSGAYSLGLTAVQEAELYLDGRFLLATLAPNQYIETPVTLEAGLHEISIRYKDTVDRSRIHLYWTRPDGQAGAIPSDYLWPPLGQPPESVTAQIQPAFEAQPLALQWETTLGGFGDQPGQFAEPRDVAVLSTGELVVADTANRRVQLLDSQGRFIRALDGDDLPFEEPLAVAVNSRDEIFVLESTRQWIYRYDAAGDFIDRFGGPEARLFHPRGLTIFEDDTIAVADTGSARIALFDADGSWLGQIGQFGDGPGQFSEPTDVLRDAQGLYFVAEAENNRIQQVDAGGDFLTQWNLPPTYAFNGPHLAFGPDGSLFVTEAQSQSLLRYSPAGVLLDQWPVISSVALVGPVGLYFDEPAGRLYVTDVQTHQVHVFTVE